MPQTPLSDHRDFRAQHELAGVDHNLTGTRNVLLLGRGVRSGAQERALDGCRQGHVSGKIRIQFEGPRPLPAATGTSEYKAS